jgi:hypothetical protein
MASTAKLKWKILWSIVAGGGVLVIDNDSYATPFPGAGGAPDDGVIWGCWTPGGSNIPQSLYETFWINVEALTNASVRWNNTCQGHSDARFAIQQHPSFPNALGTTQCVDVLSNGKCDTFDVWIDPDRDATGYCNQFNGHINTL